MAEKTNASLKIEKSCPLASAHTRLHQAHQLWHQTAESYPDPDDFVLNLNQLIVTLRQVTFMLQKQKAAIPDFDAWYQGWQKRMKADPVMTWLGDARTKIEHTGDLDLASTAKVTVIASWLDEPYRTFDVEPHVGPDEIAANFRTSDIPEGLRKEGVLKVERRWVSTDFPHQELTDVCAHGYGFLAEMMVEAHEKMGLVMRTFGGESHGHRHDRVSHLRGRLPCMLMTQESRTAYLELSSGDLLGLERDDVKFSGVDVARFERVSEEMLIFPESAFNFEDGASAFEVASRLSLIARRMLAHDGYHKPMAFLLDENHRPITVIGMNFSNQAEKYLAFRSLAEDAERLSARGVVFVGEVWQAEVRPADISPSMTRASERQDRTEALAVMVVTADGEGRNYYSPISRGKKGEPILGETEIIEKDDQLNASFAALRAMWRSQSEAQDSSNS